MVYKLLRQPSSYDLIVVPNLDGSILSDGTAALVENLGLIPSANVGGGFAMGEPCLGSALGIMEKGIANPIAMIRSGALMADSTYKAVDENLDKGRLLTPDMVDPNGKAGTATTEEVVEDILKRL